MLAVFPIPTPLRLGQFFRLDPYHVVGLASSALGLDFRSGLSQRKLPSFPRQNRAGGNVALS